jgi:heme exporter protein A
VENSSDPMNRVTITATGIAREFDRRPVFKDISFSLSTPSSLAITGENGAGKSTLSKILAGVLSATEGSILYSADGTAVNIEEFKHRIGFVSPHLNLYDEFTALENLQLLSRIRASNRQNDRRINKLLSLVNLRHRRNDLVGTFSSGMKQRLKYAFALLPEPAVLILDEPTSNLDAEGVEFVTQIIKRQKKRGILVLATSDKKEAEWCTKKIQLKSSKRNR